MSTGDAAFERIVAPLAAGALGGLIDALEQTTKPYLLITTPDCRFPGDAVARAVAAAQADVRAGRAVGAWEFRRTPVEAVKSYDPLSWETSRVAGPALLLNVSAVRHAGGIHPATRWPGRRFSWALRAAGFALRYLPDCTVHADDGVADVDPPLTRVWETLRRVPRRFGHPYDPDFASTAGYRQPSVDVSGTLVSLIMRSHPGRGPFLRDAIRSALQQTHRRCELIVVEDGGSDLDTLGPLDERIVRHRIPASGRVRAANAGLAAARGDYIGFIDDDDILWPDHVETLLTALIHAGPAHRAAYAYAIESAIAGNGEQRRELRHRLAGTDFSREGLRSHNRVPIQAVLFHRSLYKELGGFDETLPYLEDWDLWLRYSAATEFLRVPKITSLYRVPGGRAERNRRAREHAPAAALLRQKHGLRA